MRRVVPDVVALAASIALYVAAGGVGRAAARLAARTYHLPVGQYILAGLILAAAVIVLALPAWRAIRRTAGAPGRFHWPAFLLYAIPGVIVLSALPLYISMPYLPPILKQPSLPVVLDRFAFAGSELLGGAMIGFGLIRGAVQ